MKYVYHKSFFSYSHKDEKYRDELAAHLTVLERIGEINSWHDRKIPPGKKWKKDIDTHISDSDIILALLSADFMASDYCYNEEMEQALSQNESGKSVLIPIILRPVAWTSSPFGKIQALPTDGNPVTSWQDRDKAWKNVVEGVQKTLPLIRKRKKEILEIVPALFRNYIKDRIHFTVSDDSPVHRNIDRLSKKNPEAWNSFNEYLKEIQKYNEELNKTFVEINELIYSQMPLSMLSMFLNMKLMDLHQLQFQCRVKELSVTEKLAEMKVEFSLFGIPVVSIMELTEELNESTALFTKLMSGLTESIKSVKNIMGPIRDIGEKEVGEDFEEV